MSKCPKNVRKSFSKHLSEAENKNTTYKDKWLQEEVGDGTMDAFITKDKGVKQQCINLMIKKENLWFKSFVDSCMGTHCLLFWSKVHYLLQWWKTWSIWERFKTLVLSWSLSYIFEEGSWQCERNAREV